MAATAKQSTRNGRKDLVTILNDFTKERRLYYAAEAFLKDGLGIVTRSNNPDSTEDDYFKDNEYNTLSVKKAREKLEKREAIKPLGFIARETLKRQRGAAGNVQAIPDRYDQILVFACEAKEGIARSDIAALTRAFNYLHASNDKIYNTTNRPVIVLVRHGRMLSLATCVREKKTDTQDLVGEVIVLYGIDCERPKKGHLQILKGMVEKVRGCSTYEELFYRLTDSLSIKIVSDKFFEKYRELFVKIVKKVSEDKAVVAEFRRFPDTERAIRNYVKKLMGRIVFIQFLQRKGWMGVPVTDEGWTEGDPEFLQNLYDRCEKKDSFVEVLGQLFDDLNSKREGDLASKRLGEGIKVPYLNGGLFERDEYDSVKFRLPEEMMGEMLEFFRSYNFTIDENDQESVEVGVDPEMLSRIFESLLEDNKETGAFYTPKEIVTYMCREALTAYLQSGTEDGLKKDAFRSFVRDHNVGVLDDGNLDYVETKLEAVKICDPAIGSGAFPMGMLKELLECRRAIQSYRNGGECNPLEIKKDILQNSIYGVDIDKGAVDIARLRFWLALIIDEKTPHALPNMDFKIMQGDSLLEQFEGIDLSKIKTIEKKKGKGKVKKELVLNLDEDDDIHNIQVAIREYYQTDSYATKAGLRESINDNVKEYICHLQDCTPDKRKKIRAMSIPNDRFFLWHLYFKEVFDEGGFDIVIGNPPYIRLQEMKDMSKVYAGCGFKTFIKSGDIYCLFTERGFDLLKEGGTLCYIMMNKWMKADYGQPLRRFIMDRKIHRIVDFGDAQLFKNATTYPCIILLGNSKPEGTFQACRLKENDPEVADRLLEEFPEVADRLMDDFPTSELNEEGWVTSTSKEMLLYKKLKNKFTVLSEYLGAPAKYGIKPGSKAFLITPETRESLIGECASAEEVIVPFFSGLGIRPYEQPQTSRYMILFRKGDTLRLMGRDQATEEEAWRFLQSRYPSICGYLQPFEEKARTRSDQGDFWWELRACTYYGQFEMPKIMYQNVQVKPGFIYDTKESLCNNSMWIIPTEDKALLGLFNSRLGRWLVSDCCTQMRGGYQLDWGYFGRFPVALKKDGALEMEVASAVDRVLAAKATGEDTSALERQIDRYLYEIYGLTNGEVKVIDPEVQTFGADFELFERKDDFQEVPGEEIERIYRELRRRFDKLASALRNPEADILGRYDFTSSEQPSKEELEDAFIRWNCAILTAYRGSDKLTKEANKERNEERNKELKGLMRAEGLLFRPVDGYYEEIPEDGTEKKPVLVNEFSFFVTNTDREGKEMPREKEMDFFKKVYRLAEHYEQDSFLFTFPGANRVAFLVATNKNGREYFRDNVKFAGPLYLDVEDLKEWTGCSNEGKIAFMLKGIAQKKVPDTNRRVWIGEGDIFDVDHYHPNPDYLVVLHDGKNDRLNEECSKHKDQPIPLHEVIIGPDDDIRTAVSTSLEALPRRTRVVGFHCSARVNGSYVEGARAALEAVCRWAEQRRGQLTKIVVVDIFGDYWKIPLSSEERID